LNAGLPRVSFSAVIFVLYYQSVANCFSTKPGFRIKV
jgi:hypothetical protein